jgi:A/G-specific adenine glycosylase
MEMSGPQLYQNWKKEKTGNFRRMLLAWYRRNRRRLPWRSDPSPYRVWIAEVMLQQTRVAAVLPYYERFVERFPDVSALAAASEEEILKAWAGLGYYSRARNLVRAAQRMVSESGGRVPSSIDSLRALPGIGRYTAGAICSIAFNQPQPVVDGNVRRVITRLQGIAGREPDSFFWEQAAALVPVRCASDFNQAMMELGALVCLPSRPLCESCPVSGLCSARARGLENRIPAVRSSKNSETVELIVLVLRRGGQVLLTMRDDRGFIPGKWCLPNRVIESGEVPARAARRFAAAMVGKEVRIREGSRVRHSITWRRIVARVFSAELTDASASGAFLWAERSTAQRFLTSSLFRKALLAAE